MSDYECYCRRCNGEGPGCWEGGEHDYPAGSAVCRDCGQPSGAMLSALRYEKAEREGRAHGDHFHQTLATKGRCTMLFKQVPLHDRDCSHETHCTCGVADMMAELAESYP